MHPIHRRELLRIGGLSVLAAPGACWAGPQPDAEKHCIFLMLQGGLSHLESWDPKPDAPAEIRGPFGVIPTRQPGVRFGELFRKSADLADRLCVVRSMTHRFTNHIAGTYVTLTGSDDQQDRDREAHAEDFPGPGAILNALLPPRDVPRSVSLPNWLSIPGPSNRMPGQYGGFLGGAQDPFVVEGDPSRAGYNPLSLRLASGLSVDRLSSRTALREDLDQLAHALESGLRKRYDRYWEGAYALVSNGRVRRALDLSQENRRCRDLYGRTKVGQCLLLARRLTEAGVTMVAYNAFNQKWDTHGQLESRYRQIVPPLDQAYAALLEDLVERGRLESTLVVNAGEFGRTPTMNQNGGRDHWPNAYSITLAGGGLRGGCVLGASDWKGGEVVDHPLHPGDILATMWHCLGIPPRTEIRDRLARPFPIASGKVIEELV